MIRRPNRDEKVKKLRGSKMHWTAEDKNELKRLAQTTNIHELARRFKRTPSAILSMAYKLGVPVITKRRAPWPR
jgi:deoxyhypusine synthase